MAALKQNQTQTEEKTSIPNEKNINNKNLPTICIIIGMAGSGKTTLMQRINAHVHQHKIPSYLVNLDPAVYQIPYEANIDIRDTINYKNVMKQYKLGPNGAILTSLNLFATKFDEVTDLITKRENEIEYVLIDTPGQIEVFTWSASGQIITETLAATYPTVMIYVIDTPRCMDPTTFMSNMTYACSILYKSKLPFLIVFNKIDIQSHLFAVNWMNSQAMFEESMKNNKTYMSTLTRALSGVLDAFYKNIKTVGVSSVTGQGMFEFFEKIESCKSDYFNEYQPMILKRIAANKLKEEMRKKEELDKLEKDILKNQNSNKKTIYKTNNYEENVEKLMNLGLNDNDDDGDQNDDNQDETDEIMQFLQN